MSIEALGDVLRTQGGALAKHVRAPVAGPRPGAPQKAGGGAPVAASHAAHCALVTGVRAMAKASSHTTCGGRSAGCPSVQPIVNGPAGTVMYATRAIIH